MIKFDLPKNQSSIIKVLGVGGGGSNAVTHMYNQGIKGVDFVICNTDAQAMDTSQVPTKIQLGSKGLGAGSIPSVGKDAANENIEEIKQLLEKNTKMLFVTTGMGGGTGTGAAPVIASVAKDLGILTVGIVTIPFSFEGRKRKLQAETGIEELKKYVDTLLIICNDKLRELHGDLKLSEAFRKADNILTTAAKGIAEIITVTGYINVDFEDVKTVMKDSGKAIMGSSVAEGENRAIEAIENALTSPLLNDNNIKGADNILLYVASGKEEISMDEVTIITDYIQNEAGLKAEIIWGNGIDESLEDKISVTLVATGFDLKEDEDTYKPVQKKIIPLHSNEKEEKHEETEHTKETLNEIKLIKKESAENSFKSSTELKTEDKKHTVVFDIGTPVNKDTIDNGQKKEESKNTNFNKHELLNKSKEIKQFEPIRRPLPDNKKEMADDVEKNELEIKSKERIKKLKELSVKLKTPVELVELENTPAFIRRGVELSDVQPSSESEISRYTLSEDDDKKTEIKSNNSFLHDNVD